MKLKTLKDLDLDGTTLRNYAILKAEAVKWLNDRRDVKMYICEMDFMDFFNITEEDLE
jgi:hypothetical protein